MESGVDSRRWPGSREAAERQGRRALVLAGMALGAVGAGLAFLLSPVALLKLHGALSDADIQRMSAVGQAYGGISALLSGVGLAGVAAALLLQLRQFRTSQAQGMRMMQIDLMRMLIDDPDLRPASPTFPGLPHARRRQSIFTNLMFRYLELGYEIGYFTSGSLELELRQQLRVPEIQELWVKVRPIYIAGTTNSAQRRFVQLVDRAHAEAVWIADEPMRTRDDTAP